MNHHHPWKRNLWKRSSQRPQLRNLNKFQFWRQKRRPFCLSFKTHLRISKQSQRLLPQKKSLRLFLSFQKHAASARASPPPQPQPPPPPSLLQPPLSRLRIREKKTKQPAKFTSGTDLPPGRGPTPPTATSPAWDTVGSNRQRGGRSRRRRRKSRAVRGQFGGGKFWIPARRRIESAMWAPPHFGGIPARVPAGGRGPRRVLEMERWVPGVVGKRLLRRRRWKRRRKVSVRKLGRKTTSFRRRSASRTRMFRWNALFFCRRSTFLKPFWKL